MSEFWQDLLSDKLKNKPLNKAWKDLSKEASFRPIIYIGIGGFGCSVIRSLKADIDTLIPEQAIKDGFAFIGLDTHPRERNDVLTDSEYVALSVGVQPNNVAKDPNFSNYLGWFREISGNWNAKPIYAANKVRAVGRFAFLFPPSLSTFYESMRAALRRVRDFRENFGIKAFPKVYVVSSLAGGTGSGMLIDLFIIAKSLLSSELGENYLLQTILATPEALEGEANATDYPDFYSNTYATLKEMFHFVSGSEEFVSYGIPGAGLDKLRVSSQHMPHNIFLVTDSNTDGKIIVKTLPDLGAMVKSYLLFEIQTPLDTKEGRPKVQDGENPSYDDTGHGDMPRAFSSMGVVRFGLPYDQIEELFASSIIRRAINEELAGAYDPADADIWIVSNGLAEVGSDQLQEAIRKDRDGHVIRVPLDVEGDLNDKERTELGKICTALKGEKSRSIDEAKKPVIENNAVALLETAERAIQATFDEILKGKSLGSAMAFARMIGNELKKHDEALLQELDNNRKKCQKADQKVNQAISNVMEAAGSGFFGRKGRIKSAINSFGGDLEAFLNQQVVVWSEEEGVKLYKGILLYCDDLINRWKGTEDTFCSRLGFLDNRMRDLIIEINSMAEINRRGEGNRFSLVDFSSVKKLYDEFFGEEAETAIALRTRKAWRDTGLLHDNVTKDREWISKAMDGITEETRNRLEGLNIMRIIERFYPEGRDRDELITAVMALGSPLYPLDQSKRENQYKIDRVIAVNPAVRAEFHDMFGRYMSAQEGMSLAYFATPHEVIVYTIAHGYTGHSLTRINTYKSHYERLQGKYEKFLVEGKSHRPIHAWAGTEEWEDLLPQPPGEEESHRLFAVGRAFNYLFPTEEGKTDEKKNQAFIYNKSNNYYLILETGGKPERIGNSLDTAVSSFEDNPDWQKRIKEQIEAKTEEIGKSKIRTRIEAEYIPVLEAEIENSAKGRETERVKTLRELRKVIAKFIERDLRERKV
jgi:hypothetical protein